MFLSMASAFLGKGARLELSAIKDIAYVAAQLTDAGADYHEEGLVHLVRSAQEADLTPLGRRYIRDKLWYHLARRLMMTEVKKKHPHIFRMPLSSSFLVMGFPRTGTTHLHRLLSLDDRFQGIPLWQLRRPIPINLLNEGAPEQRRDYCVAELADRDKYMADKKSVHYNDADTPEECTVLFLSSFHSSLYWSRTPLYSFAEWLKVDAFKNSELIYKEHREYLQLLQYQRAGVGFSLKAPEHTPGLAALRKVLPETMVIQTHRNPIKASNSLHSMVYNNHAGVARHMDVRAMAQVNLDFLEASFRHNKDARELNPGSVYDVFFDDIVKRPIEVIRSIYRHYNVTWPVGHEQKLQRYLENNPRNKHGIHKYSSEDFGLTDREVRDHFAEYIETYELEKRLKMPA